MRQRLLLGLIAGAAPFLLAAAGAQAQMPFGGCSGPGLPAGAQCATLDVPLDRSGGVAGTVRLSARRVPSAATQTPTAVLALAGGPGQAANPITADFAAVLRPALAPGRDLLVFDQRGTGESSPVRCSRGSGGLESFGRRCAQTLGSARGFFRTADTVQDIEALRAAAGYDKLVIYGVSYGTKVALDYASAFPDRVERLVLDSVVPPEGPDPLQRSTFHAHARVLRELCSGGACRGITSSPTNDVANLVRRIDRRGSSLRGRVTDGRGRRLRITVDRVDLLNILVAGDLNPALRAQVPGAITSARRGDLSPLSRVAARSLGASDFGLQVADDAGSDGLFAATICEEARFPWSRDADRETRAGQADAATRALGSAAFRPYDRSTALRFELLPLCRSWPNASPAPAAPGPLPQVPTLVLNGTQDLRTPLEDARRVAQRLPGAQVVAVPFTGHSVLGSELAGEQCAQRAIGQFFADQPVSQCANRSNPLPPERVAPRRLESLGATGPRGKVGRSVTAALRTVDDMSFQRVTDTLTGGRRPGRIGGLRGGFATVSSRSMALRSVEYVPGVLISGSAPDAGTLRLRIRGRAASRGSITVTASRLTGTVGGRRINLVARGSVASAGGERPTTSELLRRFGLRTAG